MKNIERRIFDCSFPEYKGNACPVAMKFKENNNSDRPIPEAYLGNPRSEFIIVGINPGASENYLSANFEDYQNCIKRPLSDKFWQYHYVTEIFGYPPLRQGGGIVTNLVHCPTPSWTKQKEEKWRLNDEEKRKSLELCNQYVFDIIEEVNPDLILLHGLDTARFFSNYCKWEISENVESKDIHGLIQTCNGRTFVLSRHLRSICVKKGQGAWKPLEEAARKLKRE